MSIKTLRKRIALVAVSALGVGLLSVTPARAAGEDLDATNNYQFGSTHNTAYTAATLDGFCFQNTTTDVLSVRYPRATTITMYSLNGTADLGNATTYAYVKATGSGYFTTVAAPSDGTDAKVAKSADEKTITIGDTTAGADEDLPDVLTWVATAAGTTYFDVYQVTISTGASTLLDTLKLVVASGDCNNGSYATKYSGTSLRTASTALTATTYDDGDDSGAVTVEAATGVSYLGMWLRDAYGEDVSSTDSFLNATATGGCTVSWDAAALSSTRTTVTATSGITNEVLKIFSKDLKPNVCKVVVDYNGTVVADRSVTFNGEASVLATANVDAAISTASTVAMTWTAKDSAGAQLDGIAGTATDLTGSLIGSSITITDSSKSAGSDVTIDTVASAYGPGTFRIRTTLDDGSYVYSPVQNVLVTSSTKVKYALSLDKAVYKPGEIITVTISAVDAKGSIVPDGTALAGAGNLSFTIAGGSALSAAPADTDTSIGGKWVYKYTAGTTEGDWAANVTLSDVATDTAKQVTYSIKAASGTVTLNEVLASIVKLIASINKQIKALQKSIKR